MTENELGLEQLETAPTPTEANQAELDAIADGKVVSDFLQTGAAERVFRAIERKYLNEFTKANTDDARRQVWAKCRALIDLMAGLRDTPFKGINAKAVKENREALEERARRAQRAK